MHVLPPEAGLPDMVYAANGAFRVDGTASTAPGSGTRSGPPRRRRPPRLLRTSRAGAFVAPTETNEGEGDFAYLPEAYGGLILAGHGFRTEPAAHAEAQEVLGRPVVSLRLVDPRFYHLDMALAALDDAHGSPTSRARSRRAPSGCWPSSSRTRWSPTRPTRWPSGSTWSATAATWCSTAEATGLAAKLTAAGYTPVPVELAELKKGGGSVKCCIAELRP